MWNAFESGYREDLARLAEGAIVFEWGSQPSRTD